MTNEEAIKALTLYAPKDNNSISIILREAMKMGADALSNSDEDCISRQAVLALKTRVDTMTGWSGYMIDALDVEQLPSVQPKTEVLDKIRAEIEEYRDGMRWNSESLIKWEAINYVLKHIIDKYKAESEEQDADSN
jgi:hypothetical protein